MRSGIFLSAFARGLLFLLVMMVSLPAPVGATTGGQAGDTSSQKLFLSNPIVVEYPGGLAFPEQVIGTRSAIKSFTLWNSASVPLYELVMVVTGSFSVTHNCPAVLAANGTPGDRCTVSLTFAPTASGPAAGTLTVYSTADNGPLIIPLSGTGIVSGTDSYAYITNRDAGTLSIINLSSNTASAPVAVGSQPEGVAVSPDGTRAYIGNFGSGTVSVVNAATQSVEKAFVVAGGGGVRGIALSPDATRLYAANSNANTVSVIELPNGTVVATVPVGSGPAGLVITPDGRKILVANQGSASVSVIDAATNVLLANVLVGTTPHGLAVSPDGTRAYVTNFGTESISVLDLATLTVVANLAAGQGPLGVVVSPDGQRIIATNGDNQAVLINAVTNTRVATVGVGIRPRGVAFSLDGSKAYVVNEESNSVSIIDMATVTVTKSVFVGAGPVALGGFVSAGAAPSVAAIEYYHSAFDHYFVTATAAEAAALDAGTIQGWTRTGQSFRVYPLAALAATKVCRFFGISFAPKSSHFYTSSSSECAIVKNNPNWQYEGFAFSVTSPLSSGSCPAWTAPLYRLYNNGMGGAPNHRYTISTSIRSAMLAQGWISEGVAACVPNN